MRRNDKEITSEKPHKWVLSQCARLGGAWLDRPSAFERFEFRSRRNHYSDQGWLPWIIIRQLHWQRHCRGDGHLRRCWWPLASVGLWPIALSRLIRLCWSCLFTSVTQNSLQVNNHRDASYISGSRTASPTTLRWQFVFVDWLFGSAVAFKEHGRQAWNECIDAKMNAYCDGNRHLADRNMWELEQVL